MTWAEWFELGDEVRRVAATAAIPGVIVSTVFLGLDHRFHGHGRPLLFETMAFGKPEEAVDRVGVLRCSTWAEASDQHECAVADLRTWHLEGGR